MAEPKTKRTQASVRKFLEGVEDPVRREDARKVLALMEEVTGEKPRMWGPSIVGFGSYHFKYKSGREGEWLLTGFSPRKTNLTVYFMSGFSKLGDLLAKLGKHKTGKSCLYLNRLEDVDMTALRKLVKESVADVKRREKEQRR